MFISLRSQIVTVGKPWADRGQTVGSYGGPIAMSSILEALLGILLVQFTTAMQKSVPLITHQQLDQLMETMRVAKVTLM